MADGKVEYVGPIVRPLVWSLATSKIIACVCAFCAAEMAGELIRNLSEKLPVEGACPVFGVEPKNPDH